MTRRDFTVRRLANSTLVAAATTRTTPRYLGAEVCVLVFRRALLWLVDFAQQIPKRLERRFAEAQAFNQLAEAHYCQGDAQYRSS